jgi:hypothetical protein
MSLKCEFSHSWDALNRYAYASSPHLCLKVLLLEKATLQIQYCFLLVGKDSTLLVNYSSMAVEYE